jgi:hybrid cluster-associated redox disulfide protein
MPDYKSQPPLPAITSDLPMHELLEKWPETIPVFLRYRMSCIGCYMSSFDTLEDALKVHGLPIHEVLESLNRSVADSDPQILE